MKFPTFKMRSAAIVAGAVTLIGGGSALAANVAASPAANGPQGQAAPADGNNVDEQGDHQSGPQDETKDQAGTADDGQNEKSTETADTPESPGD